MQYVVLVPGSLIKKNRTMIFLLFQEISKRWVNLHGILYIYTILYTLIYYVILLQGFIQTIYNEFKLKSIVFTLS